MAEKEIALLQEQIERLNDKKFDLEAWKSHTLIYLERIFGKESPSVKMIRDLKYDYSSWGLRDFSGTGKPNNPVIVQAREILEASITELQQFGLPKTENQIWSMLEEELTGKQVKELRSVIHSDDLGKEAKTLDILRGINNETLAKILTRALLS